MHADFREWIQNIKGHIRVQYEKIQLRNQTAWFSKACENNCSNVVEGQAQYRNESVVPSDIFLGV